MTGEDTDGVMIVYDATERGRALWIVPAEMGHGYSMLMPTKVIAIAKH